MTDQKSASSAGSAPSAPRESAGRTSRRPTTVSRVVLRRWALTMLVVGLVVGVLAGRLSAQEGLMVRWAGWLGLDGQQWFAGHRAESTSSDESGRTSSAGSVGVAPEADGQAYGSGLPSPSQAQGRSMVDASAAKLLIRMEDLSEQVDFLPSQAKAPSLPETSAASGNAGPVDRLLDRLASLFRLRQVDDSDHALQSLAAYEMARGQIRLRLLAARLSIQTGQPHLAVMDLQAAGSLLSREFDLTSDSVQKAVAELAELQRAVQELP